MIMKIIDRRISIQVYLKDNKGIEYKYKGIYLKLHLLGYFCLILNGILAIFLLGLPDLLNIDIYHNYMYFIVIPFMIILLIPLTIVWLIPKHKRYIPVNKFNNN